MSGLTENVPQVLTMALSFSLNPVICWSALGFGKYFDLLKAIQFHTVYSFET